jgi:hypothetical protein
MFYVEHELAAAGLVRNGHINDSSPAKRVRISLQFRRKIVDKERSKKQRQIGQWGGYRAGPEIY